MEGFKKFLLRGNVVDLAVAVVIGAAFGDVVKALVSSFITPLIGAFGGLPDFAAWTFTVNGSKFTPGLFINALVAFIVIAAVVYFFVVMPLTRALERMEGPKEAPPATKTCPECMTKVPVAAKRCSACAQPLAT